jgi:hypothetical protein
VSDDQGVVSWNVTRACNYACSYCTQRAADRRRAPPPAARFLAAFARLPGRWEVKLSGGEPFCHPELDAICAGLAARGHRISICTNFSADRPRLERFVAAAAGRVGVVSLSYHPEQVRDEDELIARARWLADTLARRADPSLPAPSVCVTQVATAAALPELRPRAARLAAAGLTFKVQPEKQDREIVAYAPEAVALLLELGGHNLTGAISHDYRGRPCWAGARYFILDDRGAADRCYPARRARRERLGDFLGDDFRLAAGPAPCQYVPCICTVPISRGMMTREGAP